MEPPTDIIIDGAAKDEVLLIIHLLEKAKTTDPIATRNMVVYLDPQSVGANP